MEILAVGQKKSAGDGGCYAPGTRCQSSFYKPVLCASRSEMSTGRTMTPPEGVMGSWCRNLEHAFCQFLFKHLIKNVYGQDYDWDGVHSNGPRASFIKCCAETILNLIVRWYDHISNMRTFDS